MASFYVGQRVRVARDLWGDAPESVGTEGVIVADDASDPDGFHYKVDSMRGYRFHPCELEPILQPPQLIAWDEACFDRDGKYRQEARA